MLEEVIARDERIDASSGPRRSRLRAECSGGAPDGLNSGDSAGGGFTSAFNSLRCSRNLDIEVSIHSVKSFGSYPPLKTFFK